VNRQTDGFALVGQGALDGLFNPPCGIGAELAAFFGIEAFHGFHQADVAFRNQIEQREAKIAVVAGDFDDKAEVSTHHFGARFLVATFYAARQLDFFLWGQKRKFRNFPEILLKSCFVVF